MGSVGTDLIAIRLEPFGVRVTNFDVDSPDHCDTVKSLLWQNGVIVLPAGAAASGARDVHEDRSLSILGRLFGEVEAYHPANPSKSDTDVQVLATGGDSGSPNDSILFRSDMSWRVNPSRVSVLCGSQLPSKGGNTCFQSTNEMYERLSPEMKSKLHGLSCTHSLEFGHARVHTADDVKTDAQAVHPAVIKHPETGLPLLYVNENFTMGADGMSKEESGALLQKVMKQATCPKSILAHKWTKDDVVIWDNLGTQYLEKADYDELRVMHRVDAIDTHLRLERFAVNGVDPVGSLQNVEHLLGAKENSAAYAEYSSRYEHDVDACGYKIPVVATDVLAAHMKVMNFGDAPLILDVAAGTGKAAIHLMENHNYTNIEAFDACAEMLMEARRRNLYEAYHVGDANEDFPFPSSKYDAVLCLGGLAPKQVLPNAIREMIRVTKKGGLIVMTMQQRFKDHVDEIERLVESGAASLVERKEFHGIEMLPDVSHLCYVLQAL